MAEVVPAIMPESLSDAREKVSRVAPFVSSVQLDIMDGVYVAEKTWPYNGNFEELPPGSLSLPFEVDLMVADADEAATFFARAGAKRVIFHLEGAPNLSASISQMRQAYPNIEIGIALLNDTENAQLEPYAKLIDVVQFMGIARIGYQGEPFDRRVLQKIASWRTAHGEATISVDGGVTDETAALLLQAGAARLVSGSFIYKSADIASAISALNNA